MTRIDRSHDFVHAMRHLCLPVVTVLALGCSHASSRNHAVAAASPYTVVDVMPRFFAFWDHDVPAAGADTAELVRRFRARVVQPDSAFFARAAGGPSDQRIRAFLGKVGADVPAMRRISERLGRELGQYTRSFADSFPDFDFHGSVYFYPSLYIRDGGTMDSPSSVALMFGVDMIAHIRGADADLGVLFAHELFHLYHHEQHPEWNGRAPLFRRVWMEGLATYISGRLNPGSNDLALLLGDTLLAAAAPRLPALSAALLQKLDDTSAAMARPYLQGGTHDPDVPARAGYLIGLRVAEVTGRGRSVRELARLDDATVRREMAAALRTFAAATAAQTAP